MQSKNNLIHMDYGLLSYIAYDNVFHIPVLYIIHIRDVKGYSFHLGWIKYFLKLARNSFKSVFIQEMTDTLQIAKQIKLI